MGCFPRFDFLAGFGCGWDEDSPCPPGYVPIYGDAARIGYRVPAIESLQSVMDYADEVLAPFGDILSYGLTPTGIDILFDNAIWEFLLANGFAGAIPMEPQVLQFPNVGGGAISVARIGILATIANMLRGLRGTYLVSASCHEIGTPDHATPQRVSTIVVAKSEGEAKSKAKDTLLEKCRIILKKKTGFHIQHVEVIQIL